MILGLYTQTGDSRITGTRASGVTRDHGLSNAGSPTSRPCATVRNCSVAAMYAGSVFRGLWCVEFVSVGQAPFS